MASAEFRIVKGIEELVGLFDSYGSADGYLSCVIAILYFGTVYALEKLGNGVLAKPWLRGLLADYAYPVSPRPNFIVSKVWSCVLRVSLDQHRLLGWVCPHSRNNEGSKY